MSDERDEIRARIDLVELVGRQVELKRAGKHWKGLCPFHSDRNPSFMVNPQTGRYRCWSCGESGDAFTWVMKTQNFDFREALESLAKELGIKLQNRPGVDRSAREGQIAAMQDALLFFKESLLKNTAARAYCERRSLTEEICQTWELGYAPDVGEALATYLKKKGHSLAECKSLFLVSEDRSGGYFDMFRGRLMFPIRDERGELVAFGGRLLGDGYPKYINSSDTPLFRKSRILYGLYQARDIVSKERRAVLCEGYLDVIACHRAGIGNALASLGTSLTEEHAKLMKRWCDEVVILYDSDSAGMKAAERAIEVLLPEKLRVRIAALPDGEDPDTLLKKADAGALREIVEHGMRPLEYRLTQLRRRLTPSDEAFWTEATALLATAADNMELERHLMALAPLYPGLRDPIRAQDALRREILRIRPAEAKSPRATSSAAPRKRPTPQASLGKMSSAETTVLCAILDAQLRAKAWPHIERPELLASEQALALADALRAAFPDGAPEGSPKTWLSKIEPEALRETLSDLQFDLRTQQMSEPFFQDSVALLRSQHEKRQLQNLKKSDLDDAARTEILNRIRSIKTR